VLRHHTRMHTHTHMLTRTLLLLRCALHSCAHMPAAALTPTHKQSHTFQSEADGAAGGVR